MIFEKVPVNVYENFHKKFSGSNQNTSKICKECGGACEHNKIGSLLPGEDEYIAKKMGINLSDFKILYTDVLKMDDGTLINVLKLGKLCPFLNKKTGECKCKNFKPILCKIYPIIFTIDAEKINLKIDHRCKLSRKKSCVLYFEKAIPLLLNVPIPFEWFKHVVKYDNLCFDYDHLKNHRNKRVNNAFFSLEELLSLQRREMETLSLYMSTLEKIENKPITLRTQKSLLCINKEIAPLEEISALE